jgi:hypothetical protein
MELCPSASIPTHHISHGHTPEPAFQGKKKDQAPTKGPKTDFRKSFSLTRGILTCQLPIASHIGTKAFTAPPGFNRTYWSPDKQDNRSLQWADRRQRAATW